MMIVQRIPVIAIVVGAFLIAIIVVSGGIWLWGVLVEYVHPKTATERKDLVNIFVIIAAGVVGALTAIAAVGNLIVSRRNLQQQRELEEQRAQEDALQTYFEQMGDLLTKHNLIDTDREDIQQLAYAQTLTVLARLNRSRKGALVRFLHGAGLIDRDRTIVHPVGADLRDTDLSGAILSGANLRGAKLSEAKLDGAKVTEEQLSSCESLNGATMPNGQRYEQWLKAKEGNGKDADNPITS